MSLKIKILSTVSVLALSATLAIPATSYANDSNQQYTKAEQQFAFWTGLFAVAGIAYLIGGGESESPQTDDSYYYDNRYSNSSNNQSAPNTGQGGLYGDCHGGSFYGCK